MKEKAEKGRGNVGHVADGTSRRTDKEEEGAEWSKERVSPLSEKRRLEKGGKERK